MNKTKILQEDLYELLGVEFTSTINDIKKAYRKKALKCHPDKNPENPQAVLEFHKLTEALQILTDDDAKNAYDRVLRAKREAIIRHNELDRKRKKLKEELEIRERYAFQHKSADELLKKEMDRLRKEGSMLVEEEIQKVMKKMKTETTSYNTSSFILKVRWKVAKGDITNGGYCEENLLKLLSGYGDVKSLLISKHKRGSAIVEYSSRRVSKIPINCGQSLKSNPLNLEWIDNSFSKSRIQNSTIKDADYERLTLMNLRRAEKRKRFFEQMKAGDNKT